MTSFFAGLILGLGLIIPIGPQNIFVLQQGLAAGWPRVLWAVLAASTCDSLLILVGALGASRFIDEIPGLRPALLILGALFLAFLAAQALRSARRGHEPTSLVDGPPLSARRVLLTTASVSLLNPHAILDTVGVIGAAVVSRESDTRVAFAAGTLCASWLWFSLLGLAASRLRRNLTGRMLRAIDLASGLVLLCFAALLAAEFLRSR
ncbi:MAG: LysE/ArgO family amino acid transporter [Angustibacter sp.]